MRQFQIGNDLSETWCDINPRLLAVFSFTLLPSQTKCLSHRFRAAIRGQSFPNYNGTCVGLSPVVGPH